MTHISESKPNIIMLGPDREVHGGISAVVNNLYDAGLGEKVNITYIPTMKEGSKLKKLIVAIKAYIKFCLVLKDADVVHVNVASDRSFERKAFFIKKAYKLSQKRIKKARSQDKAHKPKIIIHQHGGNFKYYYHDECNESKKKKIRNILDMADRMLVLSDDLKMFFGNLTNDDKIEVFPNTILVATDDQAKNSVIQRKYGTHNILFLGRICKDKGIDELIEAARILKNQYDDLKIYVGGIFEETVYQDKFNANKDIIEFVGWVSGEKKNNLLMKSDILVLPSYYEGFPVSIIDGMSKGCVCVATSVGAVPEIIEDGIDGFVVEPKDIDSLVDGLVRAFNCDVTNVGYSAYLKVCNKYNVKYSIDRLNEIYSE